MKRVQSIDDLRALARKRLPRAVFDFFDGGAEDEFTLRDNRAAFERRRIIPRVLNDVSQVNTAADLVGQIAKLPFAVAPTGAPGFGWPRADVVIARAARRFDIPFTLSTSATSSIERVAKEAGGRLWFQTYIFRQRDVTARLVARARDAGYDALIVTVDLPLGGKRERDTRNDFGIPFRYTLRNCFDFGTHPAWVFSMLRHGFPQLENLIGFTPDATTTAAVAGSVGKSYDPSFGWDDLKALRDTWPRKFLVKGINHPDDARRAVALGCDAVIVSNHGGRQLDGAIASLDALEPVAKAVNGKAQVLLDGGVRRGSDVVKAMALGASGVLIGRPLLYGASVAGEDGAARALDILRDEFVRCLQLCGVSSPAALNRDFLTS